MKSVLFEDVCSQYFGVVNILRAKQIIVNLPPKEGKVSIKGKDKKWKKKLTRIAVFSLSFLEGLPKHKVRNLLDYYKCERLLHNLYIRRREELYFFKFSINVFFLHLLWIVNSINFDLYSSFCWNHLISSSFLHCFIYREPLAFLWRCDFPAPQVCSDWS